jgi:hypothetical protein
MMKRSILPLITLALALLVLYDRIGHVRQQVAPAPPSDTVPAELVTKTAARPPAPDVAPAPSVASTPTLDRLARLAARKELARVGSGAYLDSLLATTDSVVRRWPDREGLPLRVAIIEGGVAGYDPRMAAFVRHALETWERTGAGVRFEVVGDTADADVIVRWIDRFEFDRAGQTDLTWDRLGRVRHAAISLAIRTNAGVLLPDGSLLAVAVHETGHAIGLPHSGDSADVMFPATRGSALSPRDRRTAQLLYGLATGSVRDSLAP